ncbi:MAG TPA: hypothetical protein DHW82_13855 [Spirochaetia bacterium]|nr:MAG: hypothetical protein A2Y41_09765 [Spirochaetes bacterium GWB1_36_13]HCL58073.1 hypothetical protein [Spirochaetia bacterium]
MLNDFMNFAYSINLTEAMERYNENEFYFPDGKYLENGNLKYHYLSMEDSKKPPLIFLHGIMINSNIWHSYMKEFSPFFSVYALDFLGHGLSSKKKDLNLMDLVEEVNVFIEKLNLKNPIIIGHSLGGMIGGILASLYPEKLSKLIMLSSIDYDHFINDAGTQIGNQFLDMMFPFINPMTVSFLLNTVMKKVYNGKVNFMQDNKLDILLYHIKINGFQQSIFSLMKNHFYKGFSSESYSQIRCQVLLLHGEKDRLVASSHSEKLAAQIPHAQLELIKNGSHMLIEEQESQVKEFLHDFLALNKPK